MPILFDRIEISIVRPAEMRYQTVGDWQVKDDTLKITVAKSGARRTDLAVGIHEAIEAVIFLANDGDEQQVDEFDKNWLDDGMYEEPGDDPDAPYHKEHVLATIIERLMVSAMDMTWEQHEERVEHADKAVEEGLKNAKD